MDKQRDDEPNWYAIEKEYCTGTSTVREIAAKYGVPATEIRLRANGKKPAFGGEVDHE